MTVVGWLTRTGQLKALNPSKPVRRYQWEWYGELIHLNINPFEHLERLLIKAPSVQA
ncbi:hypothetical protein [Salipiger bermudensis]|uniref:hypothetical protein n=1 Tax=Salipiger bermudensis TaxID=344736 RepID=UPI001CD4C26E|nr:hypothetical protein [Salipiger bermudensis]MCA0964870.1 hypothetical protein [Salipiger bermudensis]